MSTEQTISPGCAFIPTEQCICLTEGCQAVIPEGCIQRSYDRKSLGPTRQKVLAYCRHCDRVYGLERGLRNGTWEIVGDVKVITDSRQRKPFLAAIAQGLGEITGEAQTRQTA